MKLRNPSILSSFAVGQSNPSPQPNNGVINLAVEDNGDNTLTFRFSFNANTLYENALIVGLGSSTMNNAGASDSSQAFATKMGIWVMGDPVNNIPGNVLNGKWQKFALNGYWSDKLMPYGTSNLVDYHRCIDAVLALNPAVIILSLPSNDIDYNSVEQFMNNLVAIDNKCKARNCTLFITETQPRNDYSIAQQEMLRACPPLMRAQFGKRCIPIFDDVVAPYTPTTPARMSPECDAGDNIHMNNVGHGRLYNNTITTLTNYYVDQGYTSFRIDRSTDPTFASFTVFDSGISPNTFQKTYNRQDSSRYYYRVVGVVNNDSDSIFSNIVTLQQPIYVGIVDSLININCTIAGQEVGTTDWNDLIPTIDADPNIAVENGEYYGSLRDSFGAPTSINLQVNGTFEVAAATGNTGGSLYPDNAERSFWACVIGSSVDNKGDQASFKFTGLNDAYTYTITIFPSRASNDTSRLLVAHERLNDRRGAQAAGATGGGNKTGVIKLKGLKPVGGVLEIYFGGLIFGFGYVNVVTIERNANIFKAIFPISVMRFISNRFFVNDVNAANITKINFTGSIGSGFSSWNDINVVAGTTFALKNSLGSNIAMTVKIDNIASGTLDNGASYGGTDKFPAAVLRYVRYRTLGFKCTLGGLDPTKTYQIAIIATRVGSTVINRFTVNGTAYLLAAGNNTSTFVTIDNVTPDGNNNIVINIDNSLGSGTCYISAAIVTESIPAPGSGLTVSLPVSVMRFLNTTFKAIVPTKVVFAASVMRFNSTPFIAKGAADPFIMPISLMRFLSSKFNATKQFKPSLMRFNNTKFNWSGAGAQTPFTFTKGHLYNGTDDAYVYIPAGYGNNSRNYPLICVWHGSGISTVDQAITQGPGLRISQGDRLKTPEGEEPIVIIPSNGGAATWNPDRIFATVKYAVDNYRIDLDRVYETGLSLGGAACPRSIENADSTTLGPRNLIFSAAYMVCGSISNTYDYNLMKHMGWWTLHGTNDTTQNYGNTPKLVAGLQAVGPRQPALSRWFWGVGHNIYTTHTYDRFNKTNASGTRVGGASDHDWFEWIMKFNRDEIKNADQHVKRAETGTNWSIRYFDYTLALYLTNNLPASGTKTALLARLATLKTSLDSGKKRYIIDFGEAATPSAGNVNNLSSFSSGATLNNLVQDDGTVSGLGVQIETRFGTDLDGINFNPRFNAPYYGLQANLFTDGAQISTTIVNGQIKITGCNDLRKYEIIILHISNNTSNTAKSELRVDINGVVKTEYSEMNTSRPIYYGRGILALNNNVDQSVQSVAGVIDINVQCNTGAFTSRNSSIQSIILLEI